ncbi:MAG: cation diffusion facilitator family transporter [Bacillota bacterium]|jgi:cation diffusion facilitator family transporter
MIKKLFIKDYQNTSDPAVRNRYGVVAGIFGIILNVILCTIKMIIGIFANSITIIVDAVNNLTDAASSILTIIGFKLSGKPADAKHPYGYARYEHITAMIVALVVLAVGVLFAKSSVEKIINPEELSINTITVVLLAIALTGKIYQLIVLKDFSRAIDSNTLKATALDTRNDIITNFAVLIAIIIMGIFKINIDGILGLLVSLFVIYSSLGMVKETFEPMLGTPPSPETVKMIKTEILAHEGVKGIHDLIIHDYGVGKSFATVHVEVDAAENVMKSHDLVDNIEIEFRKKHGINLTIHMDPIDFSNSNRQKYFEMTAAVLNKMVENAQIHDFRLVDGPSHTNIVFDIIEPFDETYDMTAIKEALQKKFKNEPKKCFFIITVDKKYA